MEVVSGGMIWWTLFVVLGVSGGFWFFRLLMMGKRRREKLPPGSMGWPLLGETLQLIKAYKTSDPEPFVDYRRSQYGSVFKTHLFGKPTIFSTDAEVNRFILQNEGKIFVTNYPSSIGNLLGKNSLLLMTGGLHKKLHSMTLNFASSHSQRNVLMFHIERIVCLTLDSWDSRVLLQEEAKKITFELTLKQLLSIDPGEWSENLREKYLKLIDGFFCIPVALPFTTYRNALKARSKVAEELRLVVRKRREEYEGGEEDYDMLGTLMKDSETCLSEEQIVDFLLSLLVAGYETTSTIMTLSVKFLTETPRALAQLKEEHEEIRMQKKENQKLEWSDYKSMAFTQCVINETLRMANIIAGVFRKSLTDTAVKGYIIPKGWLVFPCFRGVHLDNELYEDARTFNPWRWQKGNNAPVSFGPTFTPFGGGPRLCPGYELARVEISVFLHHLVTLFSWKVAEEDKLIFFPTTRTVKKYPIQLVRSGRRPPPEY